MTSNLKIFNFKDSEVRTVLNDSVVWFMAKDVCDVLELTNSRIAIQRLDEDEVSSTYIIDSLGREQSTTIVNEAGLYTLVLGSRKPEAKAFKRWITHEVLPSIRKHGAYMTDATLGEIANNPDLLNKLVNDLKEEQEKREEAERKMLIAEQNAKKLAVENEELKLNADKYSEFVGARGCFTFTMVGKEYLGGMPPEELREKLEEKGVLSKRKVDNVYPPNKGYERYFKLVPFWKANEEGVMEIKNSTLKLTPQGIDFIIELLK